MDCSPPASSAHGIVQTRILEWVATSSPGDLPDPGIKAQVSWIAGNSLPSEPLGKTTCSTLKSNTQFILEESKGLNYIYQVEKRLSKPLKAVLRNSDIIFQIIGDQACISFIHLSNALWSPFYGGKNRVHLQA